MLKSEINYDGSKNNAPIVKMKNHYLEISSPHHFSLNLFSRNTYNVTITLSQKLHNQSPYLRLII